MHSKRYSMQRWFIILVCTSGFLGLIARYAETGSFIPMIVHGFVAGSLLYSISMLISKGFNPFGIFSDSIWDAAMVGLGNDLIRLLLLISMNISCFLGYHLLKIFDLKGISTFLLLGLVLLIWNNLLSTANKAPYLVIDLMRSYQEEKRKYQDNVYIDIGGYWRRIE
jgi:hypothetical protein